MGGNETLEAEQRSWLAPVCDVLGNALSCAPASRLRATEDVARVAIRSVEALTRALAGQPL